MPDGILPGGVLPGGGGAGASSGPGDVMGLLDALLLEGAVIESLAGQLGAEISGAAPAALPAASPAAAPDEALFFQAVFDTQGPDLSEFDNLMAGAAAAAQGAMPPDAMP